MLYERSFEPIRPEPDSTDIEYMFRFFCYDGITPEIPTEKWLPKANPIDTCLCTAKMSVVDDAEGPHLLFAGPRRHFAAKPKGPCEIKRRADGSRFCSLHKIPL